LADARRHGLIGFEAKRLTGLELAGLLHEVGRLIDDDDDGGSCAVSGARFLESVGLHESHAWSPTSPPLVSNPSMSVLSTSLPGSPSTENS